MASSASWKSPDCGEYIRIAAPDLNTGHTLIRKLVTELRIIDSVHMLGSENTYTTIDIKKIGNNKVRVALKDFGCHEFHTTDYVSVVDGGYFEEQWKIRPFTTAPIIE